MLNLLGEHEADIVLHYVSDYEKEELNKIAAHYPHRKTIFQDLLEQQAGYKFLISNHFLGLLSQTIQQDLETKNVMISMIRSIGVYNIRWMYGLGVDKWNFDHWNHLYDLFLCQGPWQIKQMSIFAGKKYLIGYPRYDSFFQDSTSKKTRLTQFELKYDVTFSRPILVWLPTLKSYYGTLDIFGDSLSILLNHYHILIKPHPHSWFKEPDFVNNIQNKGFIVIGADVDNIELYQLADLICADYGGSSFGALYTDCPLLLLDHPDYPDSNSFENNSDLYLRQFIRHVKLEEALDLVEIIQKDVLTVFQQHQRNMLRKQFFAPYYGNSSQVAVDLLRQLPRLIS